jgi:HAD superfamily hydrolase (TIGR01549 family)
MSMMKALLLDMDGVVFDSRGVARARFRSVLEESGFEFPGEREHFVHEGGTDRQIIGNLLPGINEEELSRIAGRATDITSPLKYLKLNPGAKEALERISGRVKLAIVTNDNGPNAERKLRQGGMRELFQAVVTADDVSEPKPSPEPIEKALRMLGVRKEDSLYVGDNEVDRLAGKAAGLKTVVRGNLHENPEFFSRELFGLLGLERS